MFETIKATEAQIKFSQECLDILYGSRDIDRREMLLLETKSLGKINALFEMEEYLDHNDCGTSCCIAGAHCLVYSDGSDWGLLTDYLSKRGVSITKSRNFPCTPDDFFYGFCLLRHWSSSIDNAIARLEFVVKTREVLVIDDSIVGKDELCLDEVYMRYVKSRIM